jgi:hypothetical protein
MLQAGGGLVVMTDSDKVESCDADEHDIGETRLVENYTCSSLC